MKKMKVWQELQDEAVRTAAAADIAVRLLALLDTSNPKAITETYDFRTARMNLYRRSLKCRSMW